MSTNRLLTFLRCDCCRERERFRAVETRCEAIEDECSGEFEFFVSESKHIVQLFVTLEARDADFNEDLRSYTVEELRLIACRLNACADTLESGVSP